MNCRPPLAILAALVPSLLFAADAVKVTEVDETIPTYLSGPPSPDPMFYFGRDSQGAEGRIYPYPLYNNLTNHKADKTYHLIYLENEYIKIGIIPEIGGRLFSAVDKSNGYDFIYHQHVIKPALIGLIGAWISGGIEWNIPHHHRASTFLPVQSRVEENPDGSKTIWVGELEVRQRMRWAVGYTLRPGRSYLECSVRILNRTPLENTMLCFANVAVSANENYQIIFPPSTQYVAYHFKRQFAAWPIAIGHYMDADFGAGTDVSWYKNHLGANSMFAWNYQDDFFAGYDHGRQAGIVSVADHHVVPGKKFWTWGNGPRGRMWDHILTDDDGPYIELMVGAYSDNQPDYSWLQPFEAKSFQMDWYPFRDIDGVKNANLDAAVNLEVSAGQAKFGFTTTAAHPEATARLTVRGQALVDEPIAIDPGKPYTRAVALPAGTDPHDVRAALVVGGRELVAYAPVRLEPMAMPAVVTAPPPPQEIQTDEEVDLAGQRIDQFHDPAHQAAPYWEEALRRDPGDVGAHLGLGLLDLRRARYAQAEQHFRQALARLTAKYTMPKDASPYYYLGVALAGQDRLDAAFDAFYKATWSQEWRAPAYYSLAEIATRRGDEAAALDFVDRSLDANALNLRAYGLKAALLRRLQRAGEARSLLDFAAQKTDPLDVRLMAERWLLDRGEAAGQPLFATLQQHPATAQELAAEYLDAGLAQDGADVLGQVVAQAGARPASPLVYYYLAQFDELLGRGADAADCRRAAAALPPDYVFPFQAEMIPVLGRAIAANPGDARARYYLGNLLFDWQPEAAVKLWEESAALEPTFPITWRNLAQAYVHGVAGGDRAKAIAALEKAVAASDKFPGHFSELDMLYAAAAEPPARRLALLEAHQPAIVDSDECLARLIRLKTLAGKADEAVALLSGHTFNIWEGGTLFNTGESWTDAHVVRGVQRLHAGQAQGALEDFEAAAAYPDNLRAVPDSGGRAVELAYWRGCAEDALAHPDRARQAWGEAADAAISAETRGRQGGGADAGAALARTGAQRYYQALARQKLGRPSEADFRQLLAAAQTALQAAPADNSAAAADVLAPPRARAAAGHYLAALGDLGLGAKDQARTETAAALAANPELLGAMIAAGQW